MIVYKSVFFFFFDKYKSVFNAGNIIVINKGEGMKVKLFQNHTWGSNIRRPFKAFNNHIYLPGSRSCKNHKRGQEPEHINCKLGRQKQEHKLKKKTHLVARKTAPPLNTLYKNNIRY